MGDSDSGSESENKFKKPKYNSNNKNDSPRNKTYNKNYNRDANDERGSGGSSGYGRRFSDGAKQEGGFRGARRPGVRAGDERGSGGRQGYGRNLKGGNGSKPRNFNKDNRSKFEDDNSKQRTHATTSSEEDLRSVRTRHFSPPFPEWLTAEMLGFGARLELKSLSKKTAEDVAKHLYMAAYLLDENPDLAHQHAISASRMAGRVGVVRETLGITAYRTGDFALAIRELRTFKRITGSDSQLALMIDSERGLNRTDKALEIIENIDILSLKPEIRVPVVIAISGVHLDLNNYQKALEVLEIPELNADKIYPWSAQLYFSYSDVLSLLEREEESKIWLKKADVAYYTWQENIDSGEIIEVFDVYEHREDEEDELISDVEDNQHTQGNAEGTALVDNTDKETKE